jgi:predicted enzyme related to lactoylglutathione lyase
LSKVVHFEIPAKDLGRAVKFYENVFRWKIDKWGDYDYWLVKTGEDSEPGINGAIMPNKVGAVVNTIHVDSYDESVKKILDAGGEMLTKKMSVPGLGDNGIFKDPEGNTFAIIEYKKE